jgi:tetratricopeptide (TPR) repeat protein
MLGPGHSNSLVAAGFLAWAMYQTGEHKESIQFLSNSLTHARGESNRVVAGSWKFIGTYSLLLQLEGRMKEALPFAEEAVERATMELGENHKTTWQQKGQFAYALEQAGQAERAEKLWRELVRSRERIEGPEHPLTDGARMALARLLIEKGEVIEGLPMMRSVVGKFMQQLGENEWPTLDAQYWLGQALERNQDIEGATLLYDEILPRIIKHLPYSSAHSVSEKIGEFYARHGMAAKRQAAIEALEKADKLIQ